MDTKVTFNALASGRSDELTVCNIKGHEQRKAKAAQRRQTPAAKEIYRRAVEEKHGAHV